MTQSAALLLFLVHSYLGSVTQSERFRRTIEEYQQTFTVPSIVVVVIHNDRTLWKSIHTIEKQKPDSSLDTSFPIGSCTKSFTSAAIASLVRDGVMSFDESVRKRLPSFHLADPDADAKVTLRDLLSHRTGLNGHDLLWYRASWTLDDAVGRINRLPLSGSFRSSFHYSSLTVAAAGQAAANASGLTWSELIRTRVVQPAAITGISFTSTEARKLGQVMKGYRKMAANGIEPMPEYVMTEPNPSGSIYLNAHGLEHWLRFQLDLKNDWLTETKTPQIEVPMTTAVKSYHPDSTRVSYGMGWLISEDDTPVVLHGGMIDGFRSQITLYPKHKLGIALVNNLHDSKLNLALTYELADQILDRPARRVTWLEHFQRLEQIDRDQAAARSREIKRLSALQSGQAINLSRLTGEYSHPAYGTGTMTVVDGQLNWSWSSFRVPLLAIGPLRFAMTTDPFTDRLIEFETRDGVISGLSFAEQSFRKTK